MTPVPLPYGTDQSGYDVQPGSLTPVGVVSDYLTLPFPVTGSIFIFITMVFYSLTKGQSVFGVYKCGNLSSRERQGPAPWK